MAPFKLNADTLRAVIRTTEKTLKETLADLEANDLDARTVVDRLQEIGDGLRRLSLAA